MTSACLHYVRVAGIIGIIRIIRFLRGLGLLGLLGLGSGFFIDMVTATVVKC